ncbi:hypothetical protein KW850_03430 [Bacillus sp. sid0103]|uniref:Ig-like domain-containing protein n=1 Tax=Bacillus sp. sid0103 TaxID=2856337 RepID=UPI001C44EDCC|nr:Ig-like domain-containing protein [Bacillus sp. sid0103]MBV7504318.1 hypothetical protein [Bacillus sp. sid0103]
MKISFRKRTINLLAASAIAFTPFAANLAFAPAPVHASALDLVSFHNEIFKKLTASDIADIKVAYNNVEKVDFAKILGPDLIANIDGKTKPGTAINLAKDFTKLQYVSSAEDFLTGIGAFETNHESDFNKIFGGEITVNQTLSLTNAFEENLKTQLVNSFTTPGITYDQIVTAAVDSTLAQPEFIQFDGLFSRHLGISVKDSLRMKLAIDNVIDPTKMASAALSSGLIRSKGGDIYGPNTYTLGTTAPAYTFKVKVFNNTIELDLTDAVLWKTSNSSIATMTQDGKLVPRTTGKVKVIGYYMDRPIITKEITILPKKDTTAPGIPTVNAFSNVDIVISGKAEPKSYITVKSGNTNVAAGYAFANGAFALPIKYQKAYSTLTVTAKDAAGNVSKAKTIKVLDKTVPSTPTVYQVDDNDTVIKGTAEANSIITIKNGSTTIGTGKALSNRTFSVKMKKAQKAGSTLYVTAKDAAGNVSKAKSIKVLDKTAPSKPTVYSVDSNDKVVKGKAEAGSTITIKKGSTVLATGTTSSKGNFSVKIKAQKKGTVLYVTATDKSKNVSSRTKVTVKR